MARTPFDDIGNPGPACFNPPSAFAQCGTLPARREAKNLVQADRKPLARYRAMEGALARGLLGHDNDRRAQTYCAAPPASAIQATATSGEDSAVTHAQDFTMLAPAKFENIIDLANRGEPPSVAGFRS